MIMVGRDLLICPEADIGLYVNRARNNAGMSRVGDNGSLSIRRLEQASEFVCPLADTRVMQPQWGITARPAAAPLSTKLPAAAQRVES
jgi:hypothetical protein